MSVCLVIPSVINKNINYYIPFLSMIVSFTFLAKLKNSFVSSRHWIRLYHVGGFKLYSPFNHLMNILKQASSGWKNAPLLMLLILAPSKPNVVANFSHFAATFSMILISLPSLDFSKSRQCSFDMSPIVYVADVAGE